MKIRMEITYKTPKGTETGFISDDLNVGHAILIAEDLEKTGRLKNITFLDHYDTSWTLKELKKYIEGIQTEVHNVTFYFDGGYDHHTHQSGLGCAIYYEQNNKSYRLRKNASIHELGSNNEAEYAALHLGLKELETLAVHHLPVTIVGDSMVVINQLDGNWPCYEKQLVSWMDRIEDKISELGIKPTYKLISRKENQEADQLATQALKNIDITSTIRLN